METAIQIPQVTFTKEDYNKETNEIILNLNNHRWLDEMINEYQVSHRRIFPQIDVHSPSGKRANFAYPRMDGWEIVFESKACNLRLTYK